MIPPFDRARRQRLAQVGALALLAAGCRPQADTVGELPPAATGLPPLGDAALLDDILARGFRFFWETANPANGLVPDRFPSRPQLASIASVGFALTAYVAGVQSGLVTRQAAAERALATARFFATAPQGPQVDGTAGHQGFFYHFLHMQTGTRYDKGVELSSIDTGLLLAGLLCAQAFFDGSGAVETEIRSRVEEVYDRIDWPWMQQRGDLICMGWDPKRGFKDFIDYHGYDEAMLMVLLALGSRTHAVGAGAWPAFCSTYERTWGSFMGHTHLGGAPLFWHQYSHVWVDFRGLQDDFMRARGLDYFENSRRATLAQQAYAVQNPMGWKDYGATIWGLTACDGPGMIKGPDHQGRQRQYFDYRARGASLRDTQDDGTIAPTAALSSLPFAPEIVLPTAQAMYQRFGKLIYGRYGFYDAFNTSFRVPSAPLSDGRYVAGFGWVDDDIIGIDQGPIVAMIANHRSAALWNVMKRQPALLGGLKQAGFRGGWLG